MAEHQPNKDHIEKLIASKKAHEQGLTPDKLYQKITSGDHAGLSESITLLESTKPEDVKKSQDLLQRILPHTGKSIRIGITGVPGAGKSTFIESFGKYLIQEGLKVAVLAIDPSSEKTGGAILGDKTRMTELSNDPNAYIRPTATGGSLGGVAKKTRESILLCEAAGFDVILIETVGVGQSEIAVHSMTDFFMLLMIAGAGDELQGIKRGIMEMADCILITKSDGDNVKRTNMARAEFKSALHLFPPNESGWIPRVETVSALENKGIDHAWMIIKSFRDQLAPAGWIEKKRKEQREYWMIESVKDRLLNDFHSTPGMKELIASTIERLNNGELTSYQASALILKFYHEHN